MGAKFDEVDILNPLPMSSADFISRIAGSIEAAQQANEKLVVMHLPSMKANLQERGVNFESVIVNACAASGIYFVSGAILWGSVLRGGVQNYFDAMRTDDGPAPTGASAAPSAAPEPPRLAAALAPSAAPAPPEPPAEPIGRLTRRAGTRASSRAPSVPPAQPDAVPSTFPDDVAMTSATPVKEAPKKVSSAEREREGHR